ncbi:hypothetical protein SISNIDRAFT_551016 [Sistotremastrum niveocremeum HHB9708]|uniref:Uncharacterized protein n=1 Tax=Sistotremastrum niveocremeum HHB9708 TaxID=1314777 RepID=A0A164SIV3_9AGAM|nr:hypothetical protein SISNIDRAFT_551016 [Sistotremastrum niveocremeum HHB9708]
MTVRTQQMPTIVRPNTPSILMNTPIHNQPQIPSIRLTRATPSNPSLGSETLFPTPPPMPPLPLAPKGSTSPPRHKLAPKKSKLSLLTGSRKEKDSDFSDVTRRLGVAPLKKGIDIYVDPSNDPDIGEIVVLKKKKSRGGLNGIRWALGEVTNLNTTTKEKEKDGKKEKENKEVTKPKSEDKDKWWTLGRGKSESKEKTKTRSKSPGPDTLPSLPTSVPTARRTSNTGSTSSMDLLSVTSKPKTKSKPRTVSPAGMKSEAPLFLHPDSQLPTPTPPPALIVPLPDEEKDTANKGSLAVRAMRSMRSLARIGSWAQLKGGTGPGEKDSEGGRPCKASDGSTSSWEVGEVSVIRSLSQGGFPLNSDTIRSAISTASSAGLSSNRLSVNSMESQPNARRISTLSTASSLAPVSSSSSGATRSSFSSFNSYGSHTGSSMRSQEPGNENDARRASKASSIRWDDNIETVREKRRNAKERRGGSTVAGRSSRESKRESQRSLEARKRTSVAAVFPELPLNQRDSVVAEEQTPPSDVPMQSEEVKPAEAQTPPRRPVPRARPVSEQLLGHRISRPKGFVGDEDLDPAICILNAATSDLASLINRLDLEATPGGPDSPGMSSRVTSRDATTNFTTNFGGTPLKKQSYLDSPVKKSPKESPSLQSLRPYAQSRKHMSSDSVITHVFSPLDASKLIDQPIAPWAELNAVAESAANDVNSVVGVFSYPRRETIDYLKTPEPEPEPSVVAPALKPVRTKASRGGTALRRKRDLGDNKTDSVLSAASSENTKSTLSSPARVSEARSVFTPGHSRKPSSTSSGHPREFSHEARLKKLGITKSLRERKRELGLGANGTFGPPSVDALDAEYPDSDIPDELQAILSSGSSSEQENTEPHEDRVPLLSSSSSSRRTAPSLPPTVPLPTPISSASSVFPVFKARLVNDQGETSIAVSAPPTPQSSHDGDTKATFDFTGEIQKLNMSGGSDRRSFVEQLENAFKTPARLDAFDLELGSKFKKPIMEEEETPKANSSKNASADIESSNSLDGSTGLELGPAWIPAQQSGEESQSTEIIFPSNGTDPTDLRAIAEPTLVREISHSAGDSLVEEDSVVLKSIYDKAINISDVPPVPRLRLESDTSSKRRLRNSEQSVIPESARHSRTPSEMSFQGFDSFTEFRNKFEFVDTRPGFYTEESFSKSHARHESVFSIASVSSYGQVINPGVRDPFHYMTHSRPPSEDFTQQSGSVNDTFSFLKEDPRRKRLSADSDMSTFYFRSTSMQMGHRAQDSIISVISGPVPPISMHNRSYGHNRTESWGSSSSLAHAYGTQGAAGGLQAWARHQRDQSIDSGISDVSFNRLGRPGLGDKMLQSAVDHSGNPLTSISASPPESVVGDGLVEKSSFDSLLDGRRTSVDSIFDNTGNRTSVSSDSIFGDEDVGHSQYQADPFRPVSLSTTDQSAGSVKEDDTMLTMFNGEHVRRQSIGSSFEASPCLRIEKRKVHERVHNIRVRGDDEDDGFDNSMEKARLVEKPSLASAQSVHFGEGRVALAQKGLLQRQSLEISCLTGEGEAASTSFYSPRVFLKPSPPKEAAAAPTTSTHLPVSETLSPQESESGLDLTHLNALLKKASRSTSNSSRVRARGEGHRRRHSQVSRYSVISSLMDTIQEDNPGLTDSASSVRSSFDGKAETASLTASDAQDHEPDVQIAEWDEPAGPHLRRYWALRSEADEEVAMSKVVWPDTPFSVYAVQSFDPPREPTAMQAMLEHSQVAYGPLPLELRIRRARSRTNSRPSPYPRPASQHFKTPSNGSATSAEEPRPLQPIAINLNVGSPPPSLGSFAPFSPLVVDFKASKKDVEYPTVRPRVASGARRSAFGWSKRKTPKAEKSMSNKENDTSAVVFSPNDSLRISRPRPRGRVR